jgi:hypothetical protein
MTRKRNLGIALSTLGIAFSSAIGAFVAILSDLVQKKDASALLALSSVMRDYFWRGFTPFAGMCLLLAISVIIAFIFKADTAQRAFVRGLAIVSLIMLGTPYNPPHTLLQAPPGRLGTGGTAFEDIPPGSSLSASPRGFAQSQSSPAPPLLPVHVQLNTNNRRPVSELTITLYDISTLKAIGSLSVATEEFTFFTSAGDYLLRVVAPGYSIVTNTLHVQSGQRNLVKITLHATWVPIAIQRFFVNP